MNHYAGVYVPDIGAGNNLASEQVSGGVASLAVAVDTHDHTTGKGLRVPVGGLDIDADLPMGNHGTTAQTFVGFAAVDPVGVPNLSLYVSNVDSKLWWRDASGTDKEVVTNPVQV